MFWASFADTGSGQFIYEKLFFNRISIERVVKVAKCIRKVIRIKATDSPNVQLYLKELENGQEPSYERVIPGVLSAEEYVERRKTWDKIRQSVGLDGEFYEGAETLLYPPDWLNAAEQRYREIGNNRRGETIGVDPAEGGDSTCWVVIDRQGILEIVSKKTPDTSIIPNETVALMNKWDIRAKDVWFDQGGGGGVHVDRLHRLGHKVNEVSFGEAVIPDPVRHLKPWDVRQDERRERYSYKNRRAQMYHLVSLRLHPDLNEHPFAIPDHRKGPQYAELRRQMAPIPLTYDQEGKIFLLPKGNPPFTQNRPSGVRSLKDLLDTSPDELDALALAVYGLKPDRKIVLKPMF